MNEMHNHALAMEYMGKLFDELICNFLDDIFSENENVIVKQYPCRTKNFFFFFFFFFKCKTCQSSFLDIIRKADRFARKELFAQTRRYCRFGLFSVFYGAVRWVFLET